MKIFALCFALFLPVFSAHAASESFQSAVQPPAVAGNIFKGNWKVSGYLDFTGESGRRDSGNTVSTSAAADYFVFDRIALGFQAAGEKASDEDTIATMGPRASWYFWSEGRVATYAGAGVRFGLTDATVRSIVQAELGAEYFVVPSVAFGPSFFFRHYNSRGDDYNRYGVSFDLGIYL